MNPTKRPAMNPRTNHTPRQLNDTTARMTPAGTQSNPATAPGGRESSGHHLGRTDLDTVGLDTVDGERSGWADCVIFSPQPAAAGAVDPGRSTPAWVVAGVVSGVREVFEQLRLVLAPGGVVWLDVADPATAPGGDVTGLGWRMVLAVRADGWTLRNAITCITTPGPHIGEWPESAVVRTLFLLSRERHYYFSLPPHETSTSWLTLPLDADQRRCRGAGPRRGLATGSAGQRTPSAVAGVCRGGRGSGARSSTVRNPGDVWSLPDDPDPLESCSCRPVERAGLRGAASLALASRAIALGCPPGGLVYDPLAFCGHGPVARAARQLGRRFQPAAPPGSRTTGTVVAGARSRCGVGR
jgi:hypothetical protein